MSDRNYLDYTLNFVQLEMNPKIKYTNIYNINYINI